jgi:hypothetical protein
MTIASPRCGRNAAARGGTANPMKIDAAAISVPWRPQKVSAAAKALINFTWGNSGRRQYRCLIALSAAAIHI